MKHETLINKLQKIAIQKKDSIKKEVAKEALIHNDPNFFFCLLRFDGCQWWRVHSMITTEQAHDFFDKYLNEINELTKEGQEKISTPLIITGDIKTSLAWFAFDEIGHRLSLELGIEA